MVRLPPPRNVASRSPRRLAMWSGSTSKGTVSALASFRHRPASAPRGTINGARAPHRGRSMKLTERPAREERVRVSFRARWSLVRDVSLARIHSTIDSCRRARVVGIVGIGIGRSVSCERSILDDRPKPCGPTGTPSWQWAADSATGRPRESVTRTLRIGKLAGTSALLPGRRLSPDNSLTVSWYLPWTLASSSSGALGESGATSLADQG